MKEQIARSNGIELAYEMFGDERDPALLLVMGLGCQMIFWHEDLCRELAARGFRVIRFDNRDIGHSTKIEGGPPPNPLAVLTRDGSSASYTLDDMADDAMGLLDHLRIAAAHVVGVSMGGMIAQTIAIRHPDRILSLASIMSTTGAPDVGQPREEAVAALVTPAPTGREAYVEHSLRMWKVIGSPGFPGDEAWTREVCGAAFDRFHDPEGVLRQLLAVVASPDRTQALGTIRAPTLVIHGRDDPLIQVSGGEATAAAVPNSRLLVIPGMGHDLPRETWPQVIEAIVSNTERARTALVP